ncbi:MAG: WYL domain-containing protein, partial [Lentisphaerae bacterium]|nr:WYL domain-containing protein [Lentisphaerota bacterium]
MSFAMDYEVSPKTIQRDIDFLRDMLNAPLAYCRQRKGFYYRDPTFMLPAMILSEGELLALLMASRALEQYRGTPLARDIQRIFSKLSELLPEKISLPPEYLFTHFTFTGPPSRPLDEKVWQAVIQGLLKQQTLKLRYQSLASPALKEHTFHPYHIANLRGEWYVYGLDQVKSRLMPLALARIKSARLTAQSFSIPTKFDPQQLLGSAFGRFVLLPGDKASTVRLRFAKSVAAWLTDREWHPQQKLTRLANGDIALSFPAAGLQEVQHWVLSWGRYVKVIAPAELKRSVAAEIRAMAQCLRSKPLAPAA